MYACTCHGLPTLPIFTPMTTNLHRGEVINHKKSILDRLLSISILLDKEVKCATERHVAAKYNSSKMTKAKWKPVLQCNSLGT